MKTVFSKHLPASFGLLALFLAPLVFAGTASIEVGNVGPVFQDLKGNHIRPSDGGSSQLFPTERGELVVFTATASDINGDDYYLAVCKTNSILPQNGAQPKCQDGHWAVSERPVGNGETEVLFYEAGLANKQVNDWFAFACDAVEENSRCSSASKGSGPTGSPFVMPKPIAALEFDLENCTDLSELDSLSDEELDDLERDLTRSEKRALERSGQEEVIEKREKLKKLSEVRPEFCLASADLDDAASVIDEADKNVQRKAQHQIEKEEVRLEFLDDEERAISVEFRQRVLRPDVVEGVAIEIDYQDEDQEVVLDIDPLDEELSAEEEQEIFQEIVLKHEEVEPQQGVLSGFFGVFRPSAPDAPTDFSMSVVDPTISDGVSRDTVVYESEDNRKIDIYRYKHDPTGVISNEIKNFTLYNYGEGIEEELYTIENAVLHLREDGVIEGYHLEDVSLDAAEVSAGLLSRASRTLRLDRARELHQNGNGQPDFIIPVPFALDRDNNVIEDFEYDIEGDFFNQLRVRFEVENEDSYPLVLDPSLQFTAPGASNFSHSFTGEGTNDEFGVSVVAADFTGDGIKDIAVGAQDEDKVYIFYSDGDYATDAANADVIFAGENSGDQFGRAMGVGDLNSDGLQDLVVGAASHSTNTGRMYVFYSNGNGTFGTNCTTGCTAATDADVTISGEATSDSFSGFTIATGDLDDDGDDDLITGAVGGGTDGRVYIFYNDGSYPANASSADETISGDDGNFGTYIVVGDLDGDGDDDFATSAQFHSQASLGGRAYIFYNDGTYPSSVSTADVRIDGEKSFGQFGEIMSVGDFDSDGDDDLAIAATRYDVTTTSDEGRVYVFFADGSNDFGDTACTGSAPTVCLAANADEKITGENTSDYFGFSLASGDVNNDGDDDLVVGASGANRLHVYYNGNFPAAADDGDVIITGESGAGLGYLALAVADVNGDGSNDLLGGGNNYSTDTGRLYVFYGEGGVEHRNVLTGASGGDQLGGNIEVADFDHDGKPDLAVSAGGYNAGDSDGRVYIFYNDGGYPDADAPDDTIDSVGSGDEFGSTLASGDIDADGDVDLVVAAPTTTNGTVYVFYNDGDRSYPDASSADDTIDGVGSGDEFGGALAIGDIDSDGDEDIVVGAKLTTNGTVYIFDNDGAAYPDASSADDTIDGEGSGDEFGNSIALGDIDSDGDEDIVVGAPSTTNGMVYIFDNDGAAYPDASSADDTIDGEGLNSSLGDSIALGDIDSDGDEDIVVGATGGTEGDIWIFYNDGAAYPDVSGADDGIYGVSSGDNFGATVVVGDVDDDGDDDIIVASPDATNGEVYVFYNDGAALPAQATGADITIAGEESGSELGNAIVLGDLNNDGQDDLVLGAPQYDTGTGRIYLFMGDREFAWSSEYAKPLSFDGEERLGFRQTITGDNTDEKFASAFAVGDFNGDGAEDLAVGSPSYSSGDGRVYIFFSDNNTGDTNNDADVRINGADISNNDNFGYSLAAGEISVTKNNRDDLVVGAPGTASNDGAVYVFNGRLDWSGVSSYTNANVTITGVTSGADRFGEAVMVGGDFSLTPDARDDLVIGAPDTANGTVYVYYNDGSYPSTAGTADDTIDGAASGDEFGSSLAFGELTLTQDIRPDLVVGAPGCSTDTGCAYVLYTDGSAYPDAGSADVTFTGETSGDLFGTSLLVAELSDNRDIRPDLVVGAPGYSSSAGRVYAFFNDGSSYPAPSAADKQIDGEASSEFGTALASGDFKRNGLADLAVGAPGYSSGIGRVYILYKNDGGSLPTSAAAAGVQEFEGNTAGAMGTALAVLDLDRDGWDDIIGGSPEANSADGELFRYDLGFTSIEGDASNDEFGTSFAIGDLDADGDEDLAVGAPGYSTDTGRVYIFFDQDPNDQDAGGSGVADVTITGSATNERFGESLAIGFVGESQDTLEDLVIGAPGTAATTYVYVYDGKFEWNATYDSTSEYTERFGTAGTAACGASVVVGDFAGDFREDIAWGCTDYDSNRGVIHIVENDGTYGTASDDSCEPTSSAGGEFGTSIAAGDTDGDGDLDLIGGAPLYSSSTGRVHVCTNDGNYGPDVDLTITGEASGDEFGTAVASGDLDDDGDDDIAVTAPEYGTSAGRFYLFENDGSYPTGAANAETIVDASNSDQFGLSMVAADFSSDGATDVAIGHDDGFSFIFNDGSYPSTKSSADLEVDAFGSGDYASTLASGDLNGDSKPDLFIGRPNLSAGFAYLVEGQRFLEGGAPSFTAGPSESWDNSTYGSGTETDSYTSNPTHAGHTIDFKATATDADGDNYWLLVCKSSLPPTPAPGGPTCSAGVNNQWAVSSATASGVEATASYTTSISDDGGNGWYAFVCDTGLCSSSSQGTGNSGSPFVVHLRPELNGFFTVTDTSDGTTAPDEQLKFNFNVFDEDGHDATAVVCDGSGFNEGTQQCTSEELCRAYIDRRWKEQTGYTALHYEVSCIDDFNCISVGNGGDVRYTTNGGETWSAGANGSGQTLLGVHFATSSAAYAVGTAGDIRKSTNGGANWSAQTSGVAVQLHDVFCVDADTCWVTGDTGTILATTNGGTNWNTQTSANSGAQFHVHFVDANNGWIVGATGGIQVTSNGGTNWTSQTSGTSNTLQGVYFADTSNGWAVGNGGVIRVTTNGGTNWTGQSSGSNAVLYNVECADTSNCYIVGTDDSSLADSAALLRTTNGGSNWYIETSAEYFDYHGLHVADANNAWAVGQTGNFTARTSYLDQTSETSDNLNAVFFADSSEGWAVGVGLGTGVLATSNLRTTTDAGRTWTAQTSSTSSTLNDVSFTDSNNGWAVGTGGVITGTTDGGDTAWATQTSGTSNDLEAVSMADSTTGWAVGASGTITKTTNGTSWSTLTSGTTNQLNGVHFVSTTVGWAVGAGLGTGVTSTSNIRKTTDGSSWTGQPSGTTSTLNDVFFADSSNGWAVGASGTILNSSNGGTSWSEQDSGITTALTDVYFVDTSNGWIMGDSGIILKTLDGGTTWTIQETDVTEDLAGSYFDDSTTGWVVGASGTAMYTFTGGLGVNYCLETDTASANLYIGAPEPHGSKSFTLHAYDQYLFPEDGTNESQSITVIDTPPTLVSYSASDSPSPAAGGSDTVDFSATIRDLNGDNDITAIEGVFFDDDTVNNACSADQNDCYIDSSCTLEAASGADTDRDGDCQVTVYFNANASSNWEVQAKPTDGNGQETGLADSNVNLTMPAISGIDAVSTAIAYGTISVSATSSEQTLTIENMGNQVIDTALSGENMSSGANTIDRAQQEWSESQGFTYGTGNDLVETASSTSAATGCLDNSLPVRNVQNDGTGVDDPVYWLFQAPSEVASGAYTSTNTIATITCD